MNNTSTELFINMKSVPTPDSAEYDAFFEREREKIEYGVTINGIYLSGWLYWHINHWHMLCDEQDAINFTVKDVFKVPDFRDNEWIIAEALTEAETPTDKGQSGVMIFGSRRIAKTSFASSYIGRSATIYEGSQNLVTGGNWADIDNITSILDKGLHALHPYFRAPGRLNDNPRKEFALGYKTKQGERKEWSKILMRNHENGLNTEVVAGVKAKTFLCDEVGKSPFLKFFEATKPAFTSPYGWRCSPILTGTAGLIESDSDAQKVFEDPASFNFIVRELQAEGGKKVSLFIPGSRRMEAKYETTFGEFLKNEKGILLPADSELNTVKFLNSDIEKGTAICLEEQEVSKKSKDPASLLKAKMSYPLNTEDLFISLGDSRFNKEATAQHLAYLEDRKHLDEKYIDLYKDVDGQIMSRPSRKLPVENWPAMPDDNKDAPIIVYEDPIPNAPYALYVFGLDPYNTDESDNSSSLGSIVGYKRIYDPVNGTFQDMIVCSYDARPALMKDFYNTCEMLIEWYNGCCMMENADKGFSQHLDQKNKLYLLADGFDLLRQISPNTSIKGRAKGLPPTIGVINHSMNLLYDYCNEEIEVGQNLDGSPIIKLGLARIKHRMLLKEMLGYGKGVNADRIVSFRHALVYDQSLTKSNPMIGYVNQDDDRPKPKPVHNSPFTMNRSNPFALQRRPFG